MRVQSIARRPNRRRALIIAGGILVAILVFLGSSATFYTDLLWFREIKFTDVFWTDITTKAQLGTVFGIAFAVLLLINLWIVQKITNPQRLFTVPDQVLERYRATLQPYVRWLVIGAAVLFGLFAGSGATAQWRNWLLFTNATDFGTTDPVFGKDIGFYVFKLPFHQFLFAWAFSSLVVITIVVAVAHYFMGGIRLQAARDRVAPEVRAHVSVLLGLIVLLKAWGYRLDQFSLLYSPRGTVTGASYTDVNASLPALKLLVIIAIVVGALFLVNVRFRAWILPLGGIGLLALTSIFAAGVYPAVVQRLRVAPQERTREATYIKRNIEASRQAFGIGDEQVEVRSFPARSTLTRKSIEDNKATVDNIRLWAPDVLVEGYAQLQRIRQYYEFTDVDVDRYTIGNSRRQVMLAAREMNQSGLLDAARTWVNQHLIYTHGFGMVASRVNGATSEGQPAFILQDIPPKGVPEVAQPRIYFGEREEVPFVITGSDVKELDFPREGESFEENVYDGTGGIQLRNPLLRAAFAWRFRDPNIFISGSIGSESRLLFRRDVVERVGRAAPYLKLDSDPYAAIVDGRIVWILDAYTTTDMFPYAERIDLFASTGGRQRGVVNYIRNSVKATVDAYNGDVTLYLWDEQDPIAKSWQKVFPDAFTPRSEMSENLLAHIRYPEDLFKVQSERYTLYHMTDAEDFYSKEDAWAVPLDPTAPSGSPRLLPPYYVLMRLPGETDQEFVLMRPFTPNQRQNMISWLAAKSDPKDYGKLISYVFPRQRLAFGPEQIQARINSDPAVSQQKTLWGQIKSQVIDGNLLVIPIDDSLLYVQPLYLIGSGSRLPELKRVIVVSGETVRMGESLEQALAAVFGDAPPAPVDGGEDPGAGIAELIAEAQRHYDAAQDALRRGDFAAYGREIAALKRALDRASAESAPSPSPTPTEAGA